MLTNARTLVTITGVGFTPETAFSVYLTTPASAVPLETPVFVNARTARATVPAGLVAGRYTILATDSLSGAGFSATAPILDVVPPVPDIHDVQPRHFRPAGGEIIDITGVHLSASHTFRLGTVPITLTSVNLQGTMATGRTPAKAPGTYTVDIFSADLGGVVDQLAAPVFVSEVPRLVSVSPSTLPLESGTAVQIFGTGLVHGTKVTIGGREVQSIQPLPGGARAGITGLAPGGDQPGLVEVKAESPLGTSTLPDGARYVLEDRPPGPQQIEASLAEGEARFRWINPAPYRSIAVYADDGTLLEVLPGTATRYHASSLGEQSVSRRFEATMDDGNVLSQRERVTAVALDCDRPPPLEAIFQAIRERFAGLEYEDVEHSLYGDHSEAEVVRCVQGGGGTNDERGGGGALPDAHLRAGSLEAGTGNIRRPSTIGLPQFAESEVATGFILDQPASKLEIALHHRKIAADSGVELRGRLVHVYPDDGFQDEFTFPQTVISSQGDWNVLNYFRADSDVGRQFTGPNDPGPQPCPSNLSCGGGEIPAGEYLLEIYAVGGSRQTAYYVTASDPSPEELLIAGTPCPPYPLVRVRDVSDENTLPTVTGVACTKLAPGIGSICPLTRPQRVRVAGLGYWLDSCNQPHSIEPYDTRFEFRWKIFECPNPPFDCVCPSCIEKCGESTSRECPGEDGGAGGTDGGGAGAVFELINVHELISIPETVVSPSGDTLIDVWMSADPAGEPSAPGGILNIRQRGAHDRDFQFAVTGANPYFLDPSGAYIADDVAFMAFTETNGSSLELPIPPLDPANPASYLGPSNRNAARANIRVHAIGPTTNNFAAFRNSGVDISEPSTNIADWRADGSPSLAASAESGEAWVAWVRYGGDFLVDRGMRTIVTTCRSCDPRERYQTEVVRDLQPNLTSTQIVARRLGVSAAGGVTTLSPAAPLVLSTSGINIEPDVAMTRDGQDAACVWVHDGLHQNLVDDNRGRNLLFSRWRRNAQATWSTPVPAVPPEILDRFPGILEPRIAMGYNDDELLEGLIAWTAVPEGSEPNDTGMGGLRYLYTTRFREEGTQGITFDDPVRIRGRCDAPVYAWDHEVFWELPELVDPADSILLQGPDAVILFSQRGLPGTRASTGDLMMTALGGGASEWTAPMRMTDGSRTITNPKAVLTPQGSVHTVYLDQGASSQRVRRGLQVGAGAGGGVAPSGYQTADFSIGPDLAIESCKLSHPFAAPGAMVTVTVQVENLGLTSSAVHDRRGPQPRVRVLYRSEDGSERQVANSSRLSLLAPGSSTVVELKVEAPHEPVTLVVRLEDNFKDLDPTNDSRACDFGAPCPVNLACRAVHLDDEDQSAAAVLEWDNPVLYEELYVYRNEVLVTTLSGAAERFVDLDVVPGEYAYEVRGAVGVSRSVRPRCTVTITPPLARGFRRGDTNDDGKVDISDPVATLGFLFLGGAVPACRDSSDSNDDGKVDISDGVHTLAFLFLGGDAPPTPGPFGCGGDPTADGLGECASRCGR